MQKINQEERNVFLKKFREQIKETIVLNGVNIKFFNLQKITAKDSQLIDIENNIIALKKQNDFLQIKLDIVEDELNAKQ